MKRVVSLLLWLAWPVLALSASYAERPEVRQFVEEMASRHGLAAGLLLEHFARIEPLPQVLALIAPPRDPRQKSWQAYRARFLEARRIAHGIAFWRRHAATLARAQAQFGVPAEIIVAIIGIETYYGQQTGRFPAFAALATLAFDYPPRAGLFRRELEALLLLAHEEGRDLFSYRGSYAGALGLPQFLPSSIRAYAIDFDRDGRIDLFSSATDAIGSIANFLAAHGWQESQPIAVKARSVPDDPAHLSALLADGVVPKRRTAELISLGVEPAQPTGEDMAAALIDLPTANAAVEYWLGFHNFYVLTRYNRSAFYAMAVCQLADTLRAALQDQEAPNKLPSPSPACSS